MLTAGLRPGHAAYDGTVWHHRRVPEHRFSQKVTMAWLDLDRLDDLPVRPLLSTGVLAPARVRVQDFTADDTVPLAEQVRSRVERALGVRPHGTVHLLANLRTWGFCFNPLAVYWCADRDGAPVAEVLQVTNTPWHERHLYVVDRRHEAAARPARFAKAMHVSPFLPMDCTYVLDDTVPGERVELRLTVEREGAPVFAAGLVAERRPLDASTVARALLRRPTQRVSLGIHLQALRLWRKGATFLPHPDRRRTSPEATE
jgi:DUF1365 family protein